MILKACPACRRAVSNTVGHCPYCGGALGEGSPLERVEPAEPASEAAPLGAVAARPAIALVERRLQAQLTIAIAVFWTGIVLAALATPTVTSSSEPVSTASLLMPLVTGLLIFFGVLGYVIVKLRIRYLK